MLTFLSWLVVLLGSAAALFLVGRSVVRKGLAVLSGLGDASEVAAEASEQARAAHERWVADQAGVTDRAAGSAPGAPEPLVSTAGLRWGRHDEEPGARPVSDDRVRR